MALITIDNLSGGGVPSGGATSFTIAGVFVSWNAGDTLYIIVAGDQNVTSITGGGLGSWTLLSTNGTYLQVWAIATVSAGSSATFTVNLGGSSTVATGAFYALANVSTITPNAIAITSYSTTSSTIPGVSIVTTTGSTQLLCAVTNVYLFTQAFVPGYSGSQFGNAIPQFVLEVFLQDTGNASPGTFTTPSPGTMNSGAGTISTTVLALVNTGTLARRVFSRSYVI